MFPKSKSSNTTVRKDKKTSLDTLLNWPWVMNFSSVSLVLMLSINLFYRYLALGGLSIPGLIGAIAVAFVPLLLRILKSTAHVGTYLASVGLLLVPYAVFEEGGLLSIPVIWFPVIPLIAVIFAGIPTGLLFLLVTVSEVIALWFLHYHQMIPNAVSAHISPSNLNYHFFCNYAAAAIIAASVFSSCIAILSQRLMNSILLKVEESEKQFKFLAAKLPVMVWEVNERLQLEFSNRRLNQFLGQRNLLDFADLFHKDDIMTFQKNIMDAWRSRQPFNEEVRCYDSEGHVRWITCSGVPRVHSNQFFGFIGVAVDVTERIENEKALKKSGLEKTNFLAHLSHEIRNPMSIIMGYAEIMKDEQGLPRGCSQYLERICDSSRHLLELLNDVLELGKIEVKKVDLRKRKFRLREEVSNIVDSYVIQAHKKNIQLRHTFDESVPEWINTDLVRFRQILSNLLSNAVKFTENGEVHLRASCPTSIYPQQRTLSIEVTDTGIGLDEAMQSKIFEPYTQADATIGGRFGGSGLGLALSRQLANAMRGDITLKSSFVGQGSTFLFTTSVDDQESDAQMEYTI